MTTLAKMFVSLGLDSKGYDKGLKGAMQRTGSFAKSIGKTLAIGAGIGVTALAGFGVMATRQAMKAEELEGAYHRMTKSMGFDSAELLKKLRTSSKGTISNLDLISTANRAMALGVGETTDDIATLLEIARLKGKAFGLTTTQAFGDIVTGLGRASPLILDNLGITIKLSEAHEQYARILGKEVKELTEAEKKAALFNAVMLEGKQQLKDAGDVGLSTAERFQVLRVRISNMTVAIGKRLLPIVNSALDTFDQWSDQLRGLWQIHGPAVIDFFKMAKSDLENFVDSLRELWQIHGPGVIGFFKGVVTGAQNAAQFLNKNREVLVAFAAGVIAVLVPAFVAWTVAAGAAAVATITATAPIIAIGAAVALLVLGIIKLWQNWDTIWDWIVTKTGEVVASIRRVIQGMLDFFGELPGKVLDFGLRMGAAIVEGILKGIVNLGDRLWKFIQGVLGQVVTNIGMTLAGEAAGPPSGMSMPGAGVMPIGFQHGGIIREPVLGWGMRTGRPYTFGEAGAEEVRPVGGGDRSTGPAVGSIEVGINLTPDLEDIRGQIMNAVMEATDDALRRAGFGGSFVTSGAFVP